MRKLTAALLGLTAVALGACEAGKSSRGVTVGGGPAVSSVKTCELMPQSEAEAAVGQLLPKTGDNVPGLCSRSAEDFSAGVDLTVGEWKTIRATMTESVNSVPVSGVGDEALTLSGSQGAVLYVRKGSEGFILALKGYRIVHSPDFGLALEKDLASKIAARL